MVEAVINLPILPPIAKASIETKHNIVTAGVSWWYLESRLYLYILTLRNNMVLYKGNYRRPLSPYHFIDNYRYLGFITEK